VYREALRIMGLPGYESKGDGEKRSEEQEKAYGTARTALSRFRAKGGAVAGEKDTRGGANGGGRKPQAGGKGKKSNVVELPKKWTPEKFEQFYTGMAALMVATYQKVVSQKISVPGLTEYGAAAAEFQRRVAGITKG
jgi:hypothetical protein